MIKWEHSFLTLPFGLTGAVIAAQGIPSPHVLLWICVALVAARSAAMAFNRLADAEIDATNPRTRTRALPAGLLTQQFVGGFTVVSSLLLILAAWQLNRLAFYLSPVALVIVFAYSFTKRFTRWAHLFLGLAMGIAPAAAWVAVRGDLDTRIFLLTGAVMLWGGGFDVLYSCRDYDRDCAEDLHSVPRWFGIARALVISRTFHLIAFVLFLATVYAFGLGKIALAGVVLTGVLLIYDHSLVKANDLSKLTAAFFTTNGLISVMLWGFVVVDRVMAHRVSG